MGRKRNNEAPISLFSFQDLMISLIGVFIIISLMLVILISGQITEAIAEVESTSSTAVTVAATEQEIKELQKQLNTAVNFDVRKLKKQSLNIQGELEILNIDLSKLKDEIKSANKKLKLLIDESNLEGDAGIGFELKIYRDELLAQLDEFRRRNRIKYLITDAEEKLPLVMEFSGNQIVITSTNHSIAPQSFRSFNSAMGYTEHYPNRDDYYLLIVLKPSGMDLWEQFRRFVLQKINNGFEFNFGVDLISENYFTADEFPGKQ